MKAPLTNPQSNGRGPAGRFAAGNPGGPGNPFAADVGRHRAAFYKAIRDDDVSEALATIRSIMGDAKAKPSERLAAAGELLDRAIGKSVAANFLERLEALETLLKATPRAHSDEDP
jgi:hypothetical protein